ncbi:hypothetical protein ACOSZE_15525 [Lysinibacillus fusiformis]|uniref:hypothetical protein n=1 Tax=Lysinibacillus fusiformis TaxID=28031 RepID=UPI003BA02E7B
MYNNSLNAKDSITNFDKYYEILDTEIDFDFYIPYSLGCSNLLHKKIFTQYSLDKEKYYNAYKNSPFYKDIRLTSLSASNQLATQYLIGIISSMNTEEEKNNFLLSLIKIPFKFIDQYIKKNPVVDLYSIRDLSLDYAKKNKLSIIYGSIHVFSISLYLCKYLNKKILLEHDHFTPKLISKTFKVSNTHPTFSLIENNYIDDINKFKATYSNFPIKKFNELSLNHFITELNNIYKNQLVKMNPKTVKTSEQFNELINSHDFNKGLSVLSSFLYYSNIDCIDLQNITSINHEDINNILKFTFMMLDDLNKDDSLNSGFLFGLLIILEAIVRDYKKTKKLLLDTSIEESLLELSNLKQNYQNQLHKLEATENQLSKENLFLQNNTLAQEKEISKLQKENAALLNELTDLKKQNFILNNTINEYKSINDTLLANTNDNAFDFDEIISFLSEKKLLLVGGNPKWYSNLSKVLPNLKYLNPNQLNKNLNYITNSDAVFFHYTVNNHSMFDKVQQILRVSETPIHYCGEHSNLQINLIHFHSCLTK